MKELRRASFPESFVIAAVLSRYFPVSNRLIDGVSIRCGLRVRVRLFSIRLATVVDRWRNVWSSFLG